MKVLNYHWLYPQITESAIYVGECFLTGASLPHEVKVFAFLTEFSASLQTRQ